MPEKVIVITQLVLSLVLIFTLVQVARNGTNMKYKWIVAATTITILGLSDKVKLVIGILWFLFMWILGNRKNNNKDELA